MPMEKRDRQQLTLEQDTYATNKGGDYYRHKRIHAEQLSLFPNRWSRINFASRKGRIFDSLLCHFNIETFKEAFKALDSNKALGTDGISKKIYALNLEENL